MADSSDSTTLLLTDAADPVRRLSPQQEFRLRIARNDLQQAHELDLAGATPFDLAMMASVLRSSLLNVLRAVIRDNRTFEPDPPRFGSAGP